MSQDFSYTEYRKLLARDISRLRQEGDKEGARALHTDVKNSCRYIRAKAMTLLDKKYGTVGPPLEDSYWHFLDVYGSIEVHTYWCKTRAYWHERQKIEQKKKEA